MPRMNAKILRKTTAEDSKKVKVKRNPIYIVLDTVMDTYNIGSLFRLSDAIAAEKLYICGDTEYPPSSRIHKAAVGTEVWVPWEKRDSVVDLIRELKNKGVQIVSVEQHSESIQLKEINKYIKFPVAVVVGHETSGVSKEVLEESDLIVELPMYGVNNSFNVWGTCAIVAYRILENFD